MKSQEEVSDLVIDLDFLNSPETVLGGYNCTRRERVPIKSLTPALLNKSVVYPENVYEEFSVFLDEDQDVFNNDLKYDILVLPSGLLGIEYIKSHVFYTPCTGNPALKFSTVIEGIEGVITVLMQKNSDEVCDLYTQPEVEEGLIVDLKPGEKIAIPQGYFYTFVNCTEETAIVSRVYRNYGMADYSTFQKLRGLAYFCIRKNARQEVVFNPQYRSIPAIRRSTPEENHIPEMNFDLSESLYNLVRSKTEIFIELLVE